MRVYSGQLNFRFFEPVEAATYCWASYFVPSQLLFVGHFLPLCKYSGVP